MVCDIEWRKIYCGSLLVKFDLLDASITSLKFDPTFLNSTTLGKAFFTALLRATGLVALPLLASLFSTALSIGDKTSVCNKPSK